MLVITSGSEVKWIGDLKRLAPGEMMEGTFFIILPKNEIKEQKTKLNLEFWDKGKMIGKSKTTFLGPVHH